MEDTSSRNERPSFQNRKSAVGNGSQPANPDPVIQNPKSNADYSKKTSKKRSAPKTKNGYVLTPRRRAAMLANLEKARAATKEKGYQPTEKRRAANLANLQKAQAARAPSAKEVAHAEQLEFTERFQRLFPHFSPGQGPGSDPTATGGEGGEVDLARGTLVQQAAERVWKRRQFYPRQARREGRKVMRLLHLAAQSLPRTAAEAVALFSPLLLIFTPSRVVRQVERLNDAIGSLLLQMLEALYGPEVHPGGVPLAALMRQMELDHQARRAKQKAKREARRAARGAHEQAVGAPAQQGSEADEAKAGEAKEAGEAEQGEQEPLPPAAEREPVPAAAKPAGKVPELPEKFDEFLEIFSRAFLPPNQGQGTEGDKILLRSLAEAVWARLHVYERQVRHQESGLRYAFEHLGGKAVERYGDLSDRALAIENAFETEQTLTRAMQELESKIKQRAQQLVRWLYGSDLEREVFSATARKDGVIGSSAD